MANATFERTFPFSNFQDCEIHHGGLVYPSVENFYQAMKSGREELYPQFTVISAKEAKQLWKKYPVRPDWKELKDKVMWKALRQKYAPGTRHAQLLVAYDQPIVETNYWHDNYWGSCTCARCGDIGKNRLGEMLTRLRDELLASTQTVTKAPPAAAPVKGGSDMEKPRRTTGMVDRFVANIHRGDAYDVYIGRPGKGQKGPWGNPFVIGRDGDAKEVVRKYEAWLLEHPEMLDRARKELKGKVLGCFCKGKHVCHGHVLAWYANQEESVEISLAV